MYKVAVSRALSPWGTEYLGRIAEIVELNTTNLDEIIEKLKDCDALISRGMKSDAEFFNRMAAETKCRVLARHGTGLDAIDLDAATENGIAVTFAQGANARSVAEYAVSLILALYKKIPQTNAKAHAGAGRFPYVEHQFLDKRVYVIGFGNIGRQVAKMCLGLGMRVSAYDKYMTKESMESMGVDYIAQMEDGLPQADVVSIHTPLTEETRNTVNGTFLDKMKKGAFFINTARSGLMVAGDVIDRVEDGRLGGAAFDDADMETEAVTQRLRSCEKIIFSPHVAAQTVEATDAMARSCVDAIESVLAGKRWPLTANPAVYDRLGWK